jgi:hypothetical protein
MYLCVFAALAMLCSDAFAQQDPNGWLFFSGYATSFDMPNTYTYEREDGQYFQTAGSTLLQGRLYERDGVGYWDDIQGVDAQWIKQYRPLKDPIPIPTSIRISIKLLNPQDFADMVFRISYHGDSVSMFLYGFMLKHDTTWQTFTYLTYPIAPNIAYISMHFLASLKDSGYVVAKALVKDMTFVYKDSVVIFDPMRRVPTGLAPGREPLAPSSSELMQNYPNPFNPSTTIPYFLREAGDVDLRVYDLLGREIAVVQRGHMPAGAHHASFDGSSLPSGAYCAVLKVDGRPAGARKMLLVK